MMVIVRKVKIIFLISTMLLFYKYDTQNEKDDEVENATMIVASIPTSVIARSCATDNLADILISNNTPPIILQQLETISTNVSKFEPVDIFLVGKIFQKLTANRNTDIGMVTAIVHKLSQIDRRVLWKSQVKYNATNTILQRFEDILGTSDALDSSDFSQSIHGDVMSLVANLKNTNVSGLALYTKEEGTEVEVLYLDTKMDQLFEKGDLQAAVMLPARLVHQVINHTGANARLVLTNFLQDSLFNVEDYSSNVKTSNIFGISFPGFSSEFEDKIRIIFKASYYTSRMCVYWNFGSTSRTLRDSWNSDGQIIVIEGYSDYCICEYGHVTHFALILFEDFYGILEDEVIEILEIVTTVNCGLSLLGAVGVITTSILLKNWRRNKGNKILLNFVFSITLQVTMLYVSNFLTHPDITYGLCTTIGAILHYSVISEFCWMLVIALLQFRRYVRVFGGPPKYIVLKSCIFAWLTPLIPVILLVYIAPESYVKGTVGICYPSGQGLYYSVFLPVGIILTANVIIYILIIHDIFSMKTVKKEIVFQLLLVVLLFFMLGLTWLFAFLSFIFEVTVFIVLFCCTSTLQGFVLFLFFIVFNKKTRNMYRKFLKDYCEKR